MGYDKNNGIVPQAINFDKSKILILQPNLVQTMQNKGNHSTESITLCNQL